MMRTKTTRPTMNQMVMRKEKKGAAPVFHMARSRGSMGIGGIVRIIRT